MADHNSGSLVSAEAPQAKFHNGEAPAQADTKGKQEKFAKGKLQPGQKGENQKGKPQRRRTIDGVRKPPELGMKAQGFVKAVKESGFGFISSPQLEEQLFFHASELLPPENYCGPASVPFLEAIAPGDEVEFVVGENTGQRTNFVAQKVCKLPMNSIEVELLSSERHSGKVKRELNNGQWRSETSNGTIEFIDKGQGQKTEEIEFNASDVHYVRHSLKKGVAVEFNICTQNKSKERRAVHVEVKSQAAKQSSSGPELSTNAVVLQGFIVDVNKQSGVIRCSGQDKRFVFKMADVPSQHQGRLKRGTEVFFNATSEAQTDSRGVDTAISLAILPTGSLKTEVELGNGEGKVVKRVTGPNLQKGEWGVILTTSHPCGRILYNSDATLADSRERKTLDLEDEVKFRIVDDLKADVKIAKDISITCSARDKREFGQVRTLKSNFGFVVCCQRSGQLFFHFSNLKDCKSSDLKKGDDVEFSVERDPERGIMAVKVEKKPAGSAIFDRVADEWQNGVVGEAVCNMSAAVTSSGIVDFEENGQPAKLLYGEQDTQEEIAKGDHVQFRIAENLNAANLTLQNGDTKMSKLAGRRAVQLKQRQWTGTIRQVKSNYGFVRYKTDSKDANNSERDVFYHSSEVVDRLSLKPGDEVSFKLELNPRSKEYNARKVLRTKEAPEIVEESDKPLPAPPSKLSTPGVQVPQKPTPRMPDGTRGFQFGRGKQILPNTSTTSIPKTPGGIDIGRAPGRDSPAPFPPSDGLHPHRTQSPLQRYPSSSPAKPIQLKQNPLHQASAKSGPSSALSGVSDSLQMTSISRTSSGLGLNPGAAEFLPRRLSGQPSSQ